MACASRRTAASRSSCNRRRCLQASRGSYAGQLARAHRSLCDGLDLFSSTSADPGETAKFAGRRNRAPEERVHTLPAFSLVFRLAGSAPHAAELQPRSRTLAASAVSLCRCGTASPAAPSRACPSNVRRAQRAGSRASNPACRFLTLDNEIERPSLGHWSQEGAGLHGRFPWEDTLGCPNGSSLSARVWSPRRRRVTLGARDQVLPHACAHRRRHAVDAEAVSAGRIVDPAVGESSERVGRK